MGNEPTIFVLAIINTRFFSSFVLKNEVTTLGAVGVIRLVRWLFSTAAKRVAFAACTCDDSVCVRFSNAFHSTRQERSWLARLVLASFARLPANVCYVCV